MSTGYSWEGIRQVRATLLCARRVPERLCGGYVYLSSVRPLPFFYLLWGKHNVTKHGFLLHMPTDCTQWNSWFISGTINSTTGGYRHGCTGRLPTPRAGGCVHAAVTKHRYTHAQHKPNKTLNISHVHQLVLLGITVRYNICYIDKL